MNIGPLSVPVTPLIFLGSVGIALFVARLASRGSSTAQATILYSVLIGLLVSRLSFVAHYFPAYHGDALKMIDVRDFGLDALPGVTAAALTLIVQSIRRRHGRRAVLLATLAGFVTWSTATAFANMREATTFLPAVNVLDMNGNSQPLARNDGKPLVVNLWASWCSPCRAEMPVLAEAQRDFPGIDLVFINQGEPETTVSNFVTEHGLQLHNLERDPTLEVARAVGTRAFPTTLFYDRNGKLLAMHLGPFSRGTFEQALQTLYPAVPLSKR